MTEATDATDATDAKTHPISVGQLVERCCMAGDLHATTGSRISGREGLRAHQRVQRRRKKTFGDDYQSEVRVSSGFCLFESDLELEDVRLDIRGRIDGLVTSGSDTAPELMIEELKTIRGSPHEIPETLRQSHWSQVMTYASLLLRESEGDGADLARYIDTVELRLCYFDLREGEEHVVMRSFSRRQLSLHLSELVKRYTDILRIDLDWCRHRNPQLRAMSFPLTQYRSGQYELSRVVYGVLRDQGTAYLQAPTGLGKTIGCLFPAIKALPYLPLDRVFFLTARQSGVANAERALAQLRSSDVPIRSLSITAREKVCLNPGAACDGDHCQFAKGYYSRRTEAINDLLATDRHIDPAKVEQAARTHQVCPFDLALDTARHMDVIVCDYNYVFDPVVHLRRFFGESSTDNQVLLIDEVHNLVERGREMFSATLGTAAMNRALSNGLSSPFQHSGGSFASRWRRLEPWLCQIVAEFNELRQQADVGNLDTRVTPDGLLSAVRNLCTNIEMLLSDDQEGSPLEGVPGEQDEALLTLYFDALRFLRTSEWFDDCYRTLVTQDESNEVSVSLMNVNPATMLASRLQQASAVVGFSATLSPQTYFQTMLGGATADWYRFSSPFPPSHQRVFIAPYISTGWRHRRASADKLVELIGRLVQAEPGNYLVCFPSYQYLEDIYNRYTIRNPTERVLRQYTDDDLTRQKAFLDAFDTSDSATGFAVLGGRFSEGVDLVGRRLIGVVVVGVGLPQIGPERDLIREHFDDEGMDGFSMAYQYPGFNRVLQGAGRVIRSEDDVGIVCLVDDRFTRRDYNNLMPTEWQTVTCRDEISLTQQVERFWELATSGAPCGSDDDHRGGDGRDHADDCADSVRADGKGRVGID